MVNSLAALHIDIQGDSYMPIESLWIVPIMETKFQFSYS